MRKRVKDLPVLGQFLVICGPKVRVGLRNDAFGGHKSPRTGTAAANAHILGVVLTADKGAGRAR